MTKRSYQGRSIVLLFAASLVAAACGGGTGTTSQSTPSGTGGATPAAEVKTETIKLASGQIIPRAGIDIAMSRGYFTAEKLNIEIVDVQTAPEQIPLMSSGQIDVAVTGPSATHFNAFAAGIPVRLVAPCGSSSADNKIPNAVISVRKSLVDSGRVKTVKDLAGLKIGIPNLQSKGYVDTVTHLKKAGLTEKDVTIVAPLSFPDSAAALASGALDASYNIEPFATIAAAKGESVILTGDNEIMPNRLGCAIAYGKRLVDDKALGDRFMRAYLKGVRDFYDAFFNNKGKAEVVKILVEVSPVKDAAMFDRMLPNYIDPNGELNADSMKLDIGVYKEKGYLTGEPDIAKIIDTGYAERAVKDMGKTKVG